MRQGNGTTVQGAASGRKAFGDGARRLRLPWRRIVAVALLVLALLPAGAAGSVIDAVRVQERAATTRVELSLDRNVPFRLSVLGAPDRVIVDLPELRWSVSSPGKAGGGVVAGVRAGQFKPGTTRVVIDCRRPVRVRTAELTRVRSGRYRLVIDVAADGPAPAPTEAAARIGDTTGRAEAPAGPASDPPSLIGATGLAIGDVGEDAPTALAALSPQPSHRSFSAPQPRPSSPTARPVSPRGGSARQPKPAQWVVAIDPGHGGRDPGAIGRSGIHEKQITLAFARQLRDELRALRRYRVVMTRDRDVFIRLRERTRIAQAAGADLFLSIHADKMANPRTRGLSVYTLSERASDAEAAALAERENKSDLIGGLDLDAQPPDVMNLLIDIAQRETMNRSADFAVTLVRELRQEVVLLPKTHRFAGFAVLKAPDVPSVLVELGYLSNPAEERLLRQPEYRRRLARALSRAIDAYFVRDEARSAR